MVRPIKPEVRPYIDRVKEAAEAEERARERATAQVRAMVAEARNATNRAIVDAINRGATKEAIRSELGVSYSTVVLRTQEYAALHHTTTKPDAPVEAEPVVAPAVTVTTDTLTHTVVLDGFSHPDVGTNLHGAVVFDLDGDLKIADEALARHEDPLWFDKLWATQEVQDAVGRA